MLEELKNVKSTTGKVHKVVRYDSLTYKRLDAKYLARYPFAGKIGRACELEHNPYQYDRNNGWFLPFKKTDEPITCGNCLKRFWPDGRERR